MPTLTIALYWLLFPLLFPAQALTFRGEVFPANRADSLAGVVRQEIATLEQAQDSMEYYMEKWEKEYGDDPRNYWYLEKKAKAEEFRPRLDSMLRVLRGELEGLD